MLNLDIILFCLLGVRMLKSFRYQKQQSTSFYFVFKFAFFILFLFNFLNFSSSNQSQLLIVEFYKSGSIFIYFYCKNLGKVWKVALIWGNLMNHGPYLKTGNILKHPNFLLLSLKNHLLEIKLWKIIRRIIQIPCQYSCFSESSS